MSDSAGVEVTNVNYLDKKHFAETHVILAA